MLIECKHCGAPLDVKSNERTTKCKYCDTVSQIKQSRTVAFETPPGWRPPQQWTPPANTAADPAKTLVYHATTAVSRIVKTVIVLAILGAVLPIVLSIVIAAVEVKRQEPNVQQVLSAAQVAIQQATTQIETARQMAVAPQENLLETTAVTRLVGKYEEALGTTDVRALSLTIHPTHATLVAQDPKNPKHVDTYNFRAGSVGQPEPYRLSGDEKESLEKHLFDLDDATGLQKLSDLMQQTLSTLDYEGGKVSHVIVESNLPFTKYVVIRVYASSERESGGRIDFKKDGKVDRVFK